MPRPEQVVFVYGDAAQTKDGVPVLTFLIPQAGWDYMVAGLGHEFDLTHLGVPIKVLIGRCNTREDGIAALRAAGLDLKDVQAVDVRFNQKRRPE
jgi:hypothetical protein